MQHNKSSDKKQTIGDLLESGDQVEPEKFFEQLSPSILSITNQQTASLQETIKSFHPEKDTARELFPPLSSMLSGLNDNFVSFMLSATKSINLQTVVDFPEPSRYELPYSDKSYTIINFNNLISDKRLCGEIIDDGEKQTLVLKVNSERMADIVRQLIHDGNVEILVPEIFDDIEEKL